MKKMFEEPCQDCIFPNEHNFKIVHWLKRHPVLCNILCQLDRDRKPTVILALACIIWLCVAPSWYDWLEESKLGEWLTQYCSFLYECWFVNVPVCMLLGWLSIRWGCKIWKDEDLRTYRPFLIGLALSLLFRSQPLFATIFDDCDYRCFFVLLLSFPTIAIIKNSCGWICAESGKKDCLEVESDSRAEVIDKINGFTLDYDKQPNTSKSLEKYADAIVHRLLNTDLSEQAYAIGITSKWGSGKTTFLDMLREKLRDESEIVNFSPWNCRTPEQVIEDFFATVQTNLSTKHSSIIRSLRDYAKLVNSVSVSLPYGFSFTLKPFSEERNISKKRDDLSKRFSLIQKPVVVFIDDLDRLEGNEVFEVLRLIRNTANLSNMIYIVAYDRDYVTNILDKKSICNSSDYVDKIFPVEVHLPKVENYQLWETLKSDVIRQSHSDEDSVDSFFMQFDQFERELVLKMLDSYRSIKRFTRQYVINFEHVITVVNGSIDSQEFFWLELLYAYDKQIYELLANKPETLLYKYGSQYCLREGIYNVVSKDRSHEDYQYLGNDIWETYTPEILYLLFGRYRTTDKESICYLENYYKYFVLNVSPFSLSPSEFKTIYANNAKIEDIINSWIENDKNITSILFQFQKEDVKRLSDSLSTKYMQGLLTFSVQTLPLLIQEVSVRNLFNTQLFMKKQYNHVSVVMKDWFAKRIENKDSLESICRLLNKLYGTVFDEDYMAKYSVTTILDNKDIESFLKKAIETYLVSHQNVNATSLFDDQGELGRLFGVCCVETINITGGTSERKSVQKNKQVVFSIVIKHFKEKDKPDVRDFYNALYLFLHGKSAQHKFVQQTFEDGTIFDDVDETFVRSYFGSNYKKKLNEFKEKCFINNNNK